MVKKYFIHKTALVESRKIGKGTKIWAFAHILPDAVMGKNVNICDHVFIENKVQIGDNVTIKNGVSIWDGIRIEDGVFIGPGVIFTNDRLPRSKNKNYKLEKISIKKGATIGAGSVVLAGLTIGEHAMAGAGSVVTKDVEPFTLVFGNPAIFKDFICVCAKKMNFSGNNYKCNCGRKFKLIGSKVKLC